MPRLDLQGCAAGRAWLEGYDRLVASERLAATLALYIQEWAR